MTPTVALFAEPNVSLEDTAVASVADASAPNIVNFKKLIKSALIEDDRSIIFLLVLLINHFVFENKGYPFYYGFLCLPYLR